MTRHFPTRALMQMQGFEFKEYFASEEEKQEYYKEYDFAYETDNKVSRFCEGIAFGADDTLCGSIGVIMGLDTRNVDISRWYELTTSNATEIKFYANGRIDVKFKDSAAAENCFKRLRLSEIKLKDEN